MHFIFCNAIWAYYSERREVLETDSESWLCIRVRRTTTGCIKVGSGEKWFQAYLKMISAKNSLGIDQYGGGGEDLHIFSHKSCEFS